MKMTEAELNDIVADMFVATVHSDADRLARCRDQASRLMPEEREYVSRELGAALKRFHAHNDKGIERVHVSVPGDRPYLNFKPGGIGERALMGLRAPDRTFEDRADQDRPERLLDVCLQDLQNIHHQLYDAGLTGDKVAFGQYWRVAASLHDKRRNLEARVRANASVRASSGRAPPGMPHPAVWMEQDRIANARYQRAREPGGPLAADPTPAECVHQMQDKYVLGTIHYRDQQLILARKPTAHLPDDLVAWCRYFVKKLAEQSIPICVRSFTTQPDDSPLNYVEVVISHSTLHDTKLSFNHWVYLATVARAKAEIAGIAGKVTWMGSIDRDQGNRWRYTP